MTQEQTAPSKSTNEAARNLREYMEAHFEAGRVPSGDTRLMQSTLDAALATERRNTVEQLHGPDCSARKDVDFECSCGLEDFVLGLHGRVRTILIEEADRDR